ncbi:MAG: AmmeMemoRadiSam system protein B [Candidatus Cloacimonadales bacterium]|jgi:hypothetical protein|nr:AmmeMemoRadiSam system protein B [Candidatus Cloacimonadota bacterium]MDY0381695.1 AmmeMemoRadiSam system protein B [Candidatus Cloacimonadaceae bacterium]MCB5256766.1 AmmeMemoRadiSam system protein B [Candidatus Cloacimonadota bacterium]MCB5263983.1 AmmeMemoRadiSam system protein B [Candidatus Cloacimonadota bacterium]MCB5277249.1 AmmeMemoRadiSam system protein B [Candidatus Cloacimonadota bacterium]
MIRKALHAGTFYPRFGNQIQDSIAKWTKDAMPSAANEHSLGIILPHAGYVYSGACAALGLASVAGERWDSIIIVHPSHQGIHFDFSVSPFNEYESPLGNLMLDKELYRILSPAGEKELELDYHRLEHSLEIQLPLIKHFFPNATICPVMLGNQIPSVAQRLGALLYDAVYKSARRILIVVSSDLSHYHDSDTAEKMDAQLIRYVTELNPEGLWRGHDLGKLEACGIGGIATLLYMASQYRSPKVRVIDYTHSGKVSGMNNQVVGYLAAKIFE